MNSSDVSTELELSIEEIMNEAVKGTRYEKPKLPEPTLHEQLGSYEDVGRRLADRINEARILLVDTFEKKLAETKTTFERKMHQLQQERADALQSMAREFYQKRAELESMIRRIRHEED